MARVNFKRYGGEHNRPGNDGGCFKRALWAVRKFGGVLEHPADSHAWAAHGLTRPSTDPWWENDHHASGAWVCEVWQSAYGHRARKRTWLFYCGHRPPLECDWARNLGTHQCGWFDRNKPTLGKREASATPPAFAEFLVELARRSHV